MALVKRTVFDASKPARGSRRGRRESQTPAPSPRSRGARASASSRKKTQPNLVDDLVRAATIGWQQSLIARGKPPLEEELDPAFLDTERGRAALELMRRAGVDLASPWAPPFWNLRAAVERGG